MRLTGTASSGPAAPGDRAPGRPWSGPGPCMGGGCICTACGLLEARSIVSGSARHQINEGSMK